MTSPGPISEDSADRLKIPDDLPLGQADAGPLERVVANLVDNALRHIPAGSPVEVSAAVSGGGVMLTVCDHGSGAPREHWITMFAPFRRGAADPDRVAPPGDLCAQPGAAGDQQQLLAHLRCKLEPDPLHPLHPVIEPGIG